MIDPRRGFIYSTGDVPRGGSRGFFDASAGMLIFNKSFFAGFAAHHLNMPNESMIVGNSPVYGYLLSFKDDSILESLDELEDYQSDRAFAENLYNRQSIEVFENKSISLGIAWAYFMTLEQVTRFDGIPQPNGLFSTSLT
jgi:gamma-glutamylcyclotransferase (GGCT)/AIG2-like uncharacterized protein YtfP